MIRAYAAGLITGTVLMAGASIAAPSAKADVDGAAVAYAAAFGSIVCEVLDEYPSFGGIEGIAQAVVEDGLSSYQAGEVIYLAVDEICPRHMPLVMSYARQGNAA
jgi:hypothetical protein